jgi:hypothetical protein
MLMGTLVDDPLLLLSHRFLDRGLGSLVER